MTKKFEKGVITVELTDSDIEKFTELVNVNDISFALMICLYMQAERSKQISTQQFIASICALKNLFCEIER